MSRRWYRIPSIFAPTGASRISTSRNAARDQRPVSASFGRRINRGLARSGWSLSSVVTLQGGFPFTPQLSYNPSNSGDTRNPVRPFVNPNFSGPVIIGSSE